jgi:hypothetical protein
MVIALISGIAALPRRTALIQWWIGGHSALAMCRAIICIPQLHNADRRSLRCLGANRNRHLVRAG